MQSFPHVPRPTYAPPVVVKGAGGAVVVVDDTCNVYLLRRGDEAVAIDFGAGTVLDRLDELGLDRITDVLVTHHHRDQVQGLARAVEHGARIWAPPLETGLIGGVDLHWQCRALDQDYDLREDRFSLRSQVAITGVVPEYRTRAFGGFEVYTLPTPGHTIGSVTYLVELEGRTLAFTGDLVYGDGRVWSLAATQWTYSGVEGQASTALSAHVLARRAPDVLFPSHGDAIERPAAALETLARRMVELIELRLGHRSGLAERLAEPYVAVTPHLLRSRVAFANSHVLVSESGGALVFDFGFDTAPWQRALLWSIDALKERYGVDRIDAVIPTHYHDDHVAGIGLLRAVEGAELWAPANVAPVLENPHRYDLPCLWPEPLRADRTLELERSFAWEEYELSVHALPGHTLYAAAIRFDVDGRRVLATGDQYAFADDGVRLNYQYRNRFHSGDYVRSASLLDELEPDLAISGHWLPADLDGPLRARLREAGERLARLHEQLLPRDGLGEQGFAARIEPYRSEVQCDASIDLDVSLRNPFARAERATVALAVPDGFEVSPGSASVDLAAHDEAVVRFTLHVGRDPVRRARVAADVRIGSVSFGEQAEALVTVG